MGAHDELLAAFEGAWNARVRPGFEPSCQVSVQYEDPTTPVPVVGLRGLELHAERLWTAFPDARVESTGPRLGEGALVAAPFRLRGTHRGEIDGLAATHRFVTVHGILYGEVADGRLARARAFFDLYGAAVQLGVLPRPGSVGERALLVLRGFGLTRR